MKRKFADWQLNPKTIKTKRVQMWDYSGVMVGLIPLWRARELVEDGGYIACNDQSISRVTGGGLVCIQRQGEAG